MILGLFEEVKRMFNKEVFTLPIVATSALAGFVYGATRPHKKPKKPTKTQAGGLVIGASALLLECRWWCLSR